MTDLEITKLCAEAMGCVLDDRWPNLGLYILANPESIRYDPLHDDAQAMALLKRFPMEIYRIQDGNSRAWLVMDSATAPAAFSAVNVDLNRAICECVAKMQKYKK